jgi:hypothetical protein
MAAFSVLREQDTANATAKINEIAPVNWHRFPGAVVPHALANANAAKPRYLAADYSGNAYGDDVTQAKANIAVARADGGAAEVIPSTPRTQSEKAAALGTVLAQDVTRNRGWIAPRQPYAAAPVTPGAADPTLASLSPNTAVAGAATPQFVIKLIGTNFTIYSTVLVGGLPAPSNYVFVSPTEIRLQMSPASSVAGTTTIAVVDHGVKTVDRTFTWT